MKARLYGVSVDELKVIVEKANGKCAICGDAGTELGIDHCHKTSIIRGLLCNGCNLGLGHFKDDPVRLQNAIRYLTNQVESVYLKEARVGMGNA